MHQHVEPIGPDIWKFYDADDVRKRARLWSHQTFVLALNSASTVDAYVVKADANSVEFRLRGRCDDGKVAEMTYVLFAEICDLPEEKKERIVREVKRAYAGGRDPFNSRARGIAKALGVGYAP